jgi:hypothetical protein
MPGVAQRRIWPVWSESRSRPPLTRLTAGAIGLYFGAGYSRYKPYRRKFSAWLAQVLVVSLLLGCSPG